MQVESAEPYRTARSGHGRNCQLLARKPPADYCFGIDVSVGAVGDALDNALAESVIGLFKTELIRRRGPWRTVEHVEAATLHWIDWFNHHRLLEINGDLPPIELEQAHYRQTTGLTEAG